MNKVTILSFSSRKHGNCDKIAEFLRDNSTSSNVRIRSFSDFFIHPCGACNYECFQAAEACPYYSDMECVLLEDICNSDLAIFVVPNYCDYPCANFFIFDERSLCFFQRHTDLLAHYLAVPKGFIVVSNHERTNFSQAFTQHTVQQAADILYVSAKRFGKQSTAGDIIENTEARQQIWEFLQRRLQE